MQTLPDGFYDSATPEKMARALSEPYFPNPPSPPSMSLPSPS